MAWYGPRNNCGCCAGDCSCPNVCVCGGDLDPLTPEYPGFKAEIVVIENMPARCFCLTKASDGFGGFIETVFTYYGLDAINGTHVLEKDGDCGHYVTKEFEMVWTSDSGSSGTAIMELNFWSFFVPSFPWVVKVKELSEFVPGNFPPFVAESEGLGIASVFGYQGSGKFIDCVDFCERSESNPCEATNTLDYLGANTVMQPGANNNFFGFSGLNTESVTTKHYPVYYAGARRQITGWRYIVSDIPQFVDVRVSGTTVYRVEGLDGFNGTYDVARREDLDCAAGIQRFQLNLTAEQYDITTSAPCLETPVPGGTKNVLATLTIPPSQSSKRILGLVIDGVGTFGYDLSDDWDSYACGPQTETLTESDPCLVHTGDWLTIESSALLE